MRKGGGLEKVRR